MKKQFLFFFLATISPMCAQIASHQMLTHFIKKQKNKVTSYQNKPLVIINNAAWLLGYGTLTKDDLHLLDRLPLSEQSIKLLINTYPVNDAISHERLARWKLKKYKRADVIKELRSYTATQCGCTTQKAYAYMRDKTKIDDKKYYTIVLQNLNDLCMFIKTIE